MKTFKDVFEENYMPVEEPCNNKQGFKIRYEYVGPWYVWNVDAGVVRSSKYVIGVSGAVCVIAYFCAALQNSVLNYSRYVELTAMLSVAALLFEIIGVVQFCISKEKMTNIDFQGVKAKILLSTLIHAFLLFCTTAICIYLTAVWGFSAQNLLVTAGYFISGASSVLIFYMYRRLTYIKQKNENFAKHAPSKRIWK